MKREATNRALRQQLGRLLDWEDAHVSLDTAIAGIPTNLRGKQPEGLPYSPWQLLEHLRICQWDILDFCRNPHYKEMKFEDYWPKTTAPASRKAWERSLGAFRADRKALQKLVADPTTDLFARIPWGDGQTILREAVLVADHNAYHVGQLVLLRRLASAVRWPGRTPCWSLLWETRSSSGPC